MERVLCYNTVVSKKMYIMLKYNKKTLIGMGDLRSKSGWIKERGLKMEQLEIETRSEEDIKRLYITPMLEAKWDKDKIIMEYPITAGAIKLQGNVPFRDKKTIKKADYLLCMARNNPIAVVEAKRAIYSVSHGLQQAMEYAKKIGVAFAYSTNGKGFVEHDFLTGRERELGMADFPSEKELAERYQKEANLTDAELKLIHQNYYSSQKTFEPRYYQQQAVNSIVGAVAKGKKRILVAMATGTGKTYVAFQTIYRLLKAGTVKRVLYLADRNVLVDQSIEQDFSPLGKVINKIQVAKDTQKQIQSYQVNFALYQQLVGDNNEKHYEKLFSPDFFDLIVVDECHRGSAKADSTWREILEYFKSAYQLGMTATPKENKYVSNIAYFGEPVYVYSLKDGIDDGFLAPFRVINVRLNISDGWRPYAGQVDYFGNLIPDRVYNNCDYDDSIVIRDRTREVAERITAWLKENGRMNKTIVFCPTIEAAERMRNELVQLNSDMVAQNPDYVVRITGDDTYGKSKLKYFISNNSEYPVIATTSKLLSTGVDTKMVKLIVLDEMIGSMTEFKQIIGRGTRLVEDLGKTHFTVMDFRGVTRLFADPDWDGPVEQDEDWKPKNVKERHKGKKPAEEKEHEYKPFVTEDGCRVRVSEETVSVYNSEGKLLKTENIIDYTRYNILDEYVDLKTFIEKWNNGERKDVVEKLLTEKGINLAHIKAEQNMTEVDDFDFICHIAYDQKPLTRKERADKARQKGVLEQYSGLAKEIIAILLDKYQNEGAAALESSAILQNEPLSQYGKPAKIAKIFGGNDGFWQAIKNLENAIYN